MSTKRTAFLIHGLVVGGAEKFFISLVNHAYQQGENPLVILLSDFNPLFHELDPGVESVILKRNYKYDFKIGSKIKSLLREKDAHQVFCVGMFSFFMMKLHFLREKKIKFILSLHSTIPRNFKDYAVNMIYTRLFQDRDQVIFICQAQKEYLRKKYFFRPKDSLLIYNGIDTNYFSGCFQPGNHTREEMRAKYHLTASDKVLVKVARLFEEKGHGYAIDALRILHDKFNCKAYLVFVGTGDDEYEARIRKMTEDKQLSKFIIFAGHQSDVRPFHCMSDLFTLTSYTTETFSLAALEAMSSGIPCSLTHIGGAAEMINENTGLLSRSKDPDSIAESWFKILQKTYDPVWLHQYVATNFSLPGMIGNYARVLSPSN